MLIQALVTVLVIAFLGGCFIAIAQRDGTMGSMFMHFVMFCSAMVSDGFVIHDAKFVQHLPLPSVEGLVCEMAICAVLGYVWYYNFQPLLVRKART